MKKYLSTLLTFFSVICLFNVKSANAQCLPGQVEGIVTVDPSLIFPDQMAWELVSGGLVVLEGTCGSYATGGQSVDTFCFDAGVNYTLRLLDDAGDGWGFGSFFQVKRSDGCILVQGTDPSNGANGDLTSDCIGLDLEFLATFTIDGGAIPGCTNPAAINYNSCATVDDGSCLLPTTNDECSNAISVPVNLDGSCSMTATASVIGASFSASVGPPNASCSSFSTNPMDVWFSFVVPASGEIEISTGPAHDLSITRVEFFTGSCAALVGHPILGCGMFPFDDPFSGLTAGETVYARIWDDLSFLGLGTTAELCITEPACDASGALTGVQHLDDTPPGNVTLQWDPLENSIGCQIMATRIAPPGPTFTQNLLAPEVSNIVISYFLIDAGSTWEWKVRCACELGPPPVATGFSTTDVFSVPSPLTGARQQAAGELVRRKPELVEIFPNPADHFLLIRTSSEIEAGFSKAIELTVLNSLGQEIERRRLETDELSLDLSTYREGLYFITINAGADSQVKAFEVVH